MALQQMRENTVTVGSANPPNIYFYLVPMADGDIMRTAALNNSNTHKRGTHRQAHFIDMENLIVTALFRYAVRNQHGSRGRVLD